MEEIRWSTVPQLPVDLRALYRSLRDVAHNQEIMHEWESPSWKKRAVEGAEIGELVPEI